MGKTTVNVAGIEKAIKGTTKVKGAPPSKQPGANNSPSRQRRRIKNLGNMLVGERKIRNLVKYCRMTKERATKVWLSTRKRGR